MKKTIAILLLAVSFNAHAVTYVGSGAHSCGVWVSGSKSDDLLHHGKKQWVLGFLSAAALISGEDILKNTDSDAMFLWIDNYCTANPLDSIKTAAKELYFVLEKRIPK